MENRLKKLFDIVLGTMALLGTSLAGGCGKRDPESLLPGFHTFSGNDSGDDHDCSMRQYGFLRASIRFSRDG